LMSAVLRSINSPGTRLTVGIEGSFGILRYPVLVFATDVYDNPERGLWLGQDLLGRGFRPAGTTNAEDIVLKAQISDGSITCRVFAEA
jgi:hypothetical protein